MSDDLIPDEVRQFILDKIYSVAELEGLLLFRRDQETEWNAETLANELYTDQEQAQDVLTHLYSQGFLSVHDDDLPRFRYQPDSSKLAQTVDRVAEIYSKYLVPVTNLIHSKPQTKVQKFADAFRLRGDK